MANTVERERLHVGRSFLARLFGFGREVVVEAGTRLVEVTIWKWWTAATRTIPFRAFSHIDAGYSETRHSVGALLGGAHGGQHHRETYTLSLVLKKSGERIPVATFSSVVGGILPDETHERGYYTLLEALRRVTGLPVGEPVPVVADENGMVMECASCGRANGPTRTRCQYCGGSCVREVAPPSP
jgi:hypothetical protein